MIKTTSNEGHVSIEIGGYDESEIIADLFCICRSVFSKIEKMYGTTEEVSKLTLIMLLTKKPH